MDALRRLPAVSPPATAAVVLLALCLVAFAGVGDNGFINLDDRIYVTQNAVVSRGLTTHGLAWAFSTTRAGNWHPLAWLSHMIDVELFGMAAGGHHLASLALHAGAALAFYGALYAMTGAAWRSFFAAALFAVHPMRVESVAWASERKDVLSLLFTMLALLAYVRGLRRPGGRPGWATAGLFVLALLAKPAPVAFPFLLLLLDWWPLGRWSPPGGGAGSWRGLRGALPPPALWREKAPLFAAAALSAAITLFAQYRAGAIVPGGAMPLGVRAANAVVSYRDYLVATLWPSDLSVFYPHPAAMPPASAWIAGLLLLAGATALSWGNRSRRPFLSVGWFWFLVALLPMIGLVQVGGAARADRYAYLPHAGLFVLAVWWAAGMTQDRRLRLATAAGGAVLLLAAAAATASLVPHWRSSLTLFTRALEAAERGSRDRGGQPSRTLAFVRNSLGLAYFDEGRTDEAIAQYRAALELNPASYVSMNNLAKALEVTGRDTEANALYVQALRDARLAEPRVNLGMMLARRGRLDDAIQLFNEALAIDPIDPVAHAHLGAALAMSGRLAQAEPALRTAVSLAPDYEPAYFNLGKLLLDQRRYAEAIGPLRESLRLEPGQQEALLMLRQATDGAGGASEAGPP